MFRAFVNASGSITIESMPPDYQAQQGEVLFPDCPTEGELDARFPDALVFAAAERRCDDVDALRVKKFAEGMPYGGKTLQLGEADQQRIIAAGASAKFALLTGSTWPEDFGWIMADNSVLPLDAAGMSALADAAAARVRALIFAAHDHKLALRSMGDVGDIEAHDIKAGW